MTTSADDLLLNALKTLEPKPANDAQQHLKKRYSERVSQVTALAIAEAFRNRGLKGTRPSPPGESSMSGAERRVAGGIGAKKVDVTWATEESGLVLACSIKSINFPNFQKNLTNRRGDLLFESVTLHRRFPYAVLGGILFLDKGASEDATSRRRSTFLNAHDRLRIFTGREDPAGRDEQYEKLYIALMEATPFTANVKLYEAGDSDTVVTLSHAFDELLRTTAERNPDFYEFIDGSLRPLGH